MAFQLQAAAGPCAADIVRCVEAEGSLPIRQVHNNVATMPSGPAAESLAHSTAVMVPLASSFETGAFGLFRNLAMAVFAYVLDIRLVCRAHLAEGHGDAAPAIVPNMRCTSVDPHVYMMLDFIDEFDSHVRQLNTSGDSLRVTVRPAVINASKGMASQMHNLVRDLAETQSVRVFVIHGMQLVLSIVRLSWVLSQHLGMYAWLRALARPGRGLPAFVFHDDYVTREEMVQKRVANMVRNGQSSIVLLEFGVAKDNQAAFFLRSFQGLRYYGVVQNQQDHRSFAARLAEELRDFTPRASVMAGTSMVAVQATPLRSIDILVLRVGAIEADTVLNLQLWEARVKHGGIFAGSGLSRDSVVAAQALCKYRRFREIHLTADGSFWWIVRPEQSHE
eukprot:TRINITY_DN32996_c0_g1_i1.p1 TRINITY_DN32996_c0_g1~~TRINITY_DN32996_c0_g1_i1.p1  ORF type:complete len:442 (+),score=52.20 TRINITY_DN32996_c0_g1_i1:154-1326(+)